MRRGGQALTPWGEDPEAPRPQPLRLLLWLILTCVLYNDIVTCGQLVRHGGGPGIAELVLGSEGRAILLGTLPLTCGVFADSGWLASELHSCTQPSDLQKPDSNGETSGKI